MATTQCILAYIAIILSVAINEAVIVDSDQLNAGLHLYRDRYSSQDGRQNSTEETFSDEWQCVGCTLRVGKESLTARRSWRVYNGRTPNCHVKKDIPVEKGSKYYLSVMVKMTAVQPRALWNQLTMKLTIKYKADSSGTNSDTNSEIVAVSPYMRPALGWQVLAGDFFVRDHDVGGATIQIAADSRKASYLIGNHTLSKIEDDPNWREKADMRIDQLRKNNITFKVHVAEGLDPSKVKLHVNLSRHDFPFGSALNFPVFLNSSADPYNSVSVALNRPQGTRNLNTAIEKYKQFFYFLYNWAVPENSLKWQIMERTKGDINYEVVDNGLRELASHGIAVRGHCITWGVTKHNPVWLLPLNGSGVQEEVKRRMDYLLSHYQGRFHHYDVNNEDMHGSFFEGKTGDPDIMFKLFNMANTRDPNVHLFTNDYSIVSNGQYTHAYTAFVKRMLDNGVPVYGIGTQSHHVGTPDITRLKKRLEVESSIGIPVWITELDITEPNESLRAQAYEDVLRLYFSMPAIEGIVMWGYWDKLHWRPQAALVEGDDFRINEAGARVIKLYKNVWSTNEVLSPTSHDDVIVVRGFHGNYTLSVLYDGNVVGQGTFYLEKGKDLSLEVNVNPSDT